MSRLAIKKLLPSIGGILLLLAILFIPFDAFAQSVTIDMGGDESVSGRVIQMVMLITV